MADEDGKNQPWLEDNRLTYNIRNEIIKAEDGTKQFDTYRSSSTRRGQTLASITA